jgi:hypothetical protein
MPMFWITLSVPPSQASRYEVLLHTYSAMKMEQVEFSEMLAFKLQMPLNHPSGIPRNYFEGRIMPGIFSGGGGFQQIQLIQLRTEGRENGDLGTLAP